MKEKDYIFNVDLKFSNKLSANNYDEAVEVLKSIYMEEYGIKLDDKEIELDSVYSFDGEEVNEQKTRDTEKL